MVIKLDKVEVLKKFFGYDSFRGDQASIIDSLIDDNDIVVIMATGGGKSLCYQIPAIISNKLTIVVSPLISLMVDQVRELKIKKIAAEYINSTLNSYEIKLVNKKIKNGLVKLLYISPERLLNKNFISTIKEIDIKYLIIDEAHCISLWGHDFRQSYQDIVEFINMLKYRPVIGAFTATANYHVILDIKKCLDLKKCKIFTSSSDRPNIFYRIIKTQKKFKIMVKYLLNHYNKCGIIYTLTIKDATNIYNFLKGLNFDVGIYHGSLESKDKKIMQDSFINNKIKLMVATNAFGMGINKVDIDFVIIYSIPISLEELQQQLGRCARDNRYGEGIILFDKKDISTCEYFLKENHDISSKLLKRRYHNLKEVINLINSSCCIHQKISKYFNESIKPCLTMCSNCKKK